MSGRDTMVLGHGPERVGRTGGRLSGAVAVRAADAARAGTPDSRVVVLGEDAAGVFGAEIPTKLEFEPLAVCPGEVWVRARLDLAPTSFMHTADAAAMLETHRAALASAYADALARVCGALRPAARARAAQFPDQDADFTLADVVTRTESLRLALRAATDDPERGAARGSALAAGLLGVRDVAQRIDALSLELEPWNLSDQSLVEDARALVVSAAMELPGDWLRATVASHVLAR